ncbi:YSIRK signal domain/LPXTG anchor domain surface protein [Streptococcus mitis]|uniref:Gram positive anchor n=1 Tax=Streptococcus mitis SK1073 TaxID=1008452 RepID=F9HDI8_STRMT|nr:YSIRK signal domain/LPXTG anchor domain surface protein [Streptococcus mitis]EGP65472.1 gram positive anchor [Streptococcus mitis SK1073]
MKDIFNKRQRFSIRKFSIGVASVLIGITLFTPSQGVLASTENNLATEIGVNSERENSTPTVEKKQEAQNSPENRGDLSSPVPKDTPIESTRTTEPATSGDKENNSLTTRASVAGEDRSSTPAVRATSNPSEVKKYELTDEYAKQIKAGVIGSEGNKLDSLLLNGPELSPEAYTDDDYLKDKEELYIYEKGGKKYVGYNSHPMLEDTDGDGIIDSKEKPDEKLKWNVSERDMIMFMELSYRDDNYIDRVLDHKKPLTESELYKKNGDRKPRYEYMMMNKELGPYWERKKSYHTSSGLDAVLYETKSDFLYLPNGTAQVLAFRGTSDVKDIKADITLGTGRNPQQGIDAENIMRELAKDKSITNLYLTGHSLGGYLVQRAMVEAYELAYSDSRVMSPKEQLAYRNFYNNVLKKGTTFNAPKVVTSLVSGREFWQKGLDSKKIAKSGKMTHYIVDNDSTIRKGVSNDSDVVINVGPTSGGHSSRSYFEADMINRRSEFISGKRISLDETGYQDKKITTVKSLEKVGETAVYSKRGDDIIKSTTVSMKDPDTGQITKNTLDEVFKKDGAKAKVVVTSIQPSIRYEKDATRAKGEVKITVAGISGTRTVTTTYTVNATDGSLIPHEGQPVIKPSTPTVVKMPAKDEVEYLKEGDDIVKNTTTYAVNPNTGVLTPTEKKEVFKKDGAKAKVVVMPIEPSIRYEKDATRAKGEVKITSAGTLGTSTVTTTYTVNATDGSLIPHEEPAVVVPSKPTVVKVPAKDEVEYLKEVDYVAKKTTTYEVNESTGDLIPTVRQDIVSPNGVKSKVVTKIIPVTTRYEADKTKDVGNTTVTNNGSEGKIVTTTSTLVNETNGTVTDGTPVVSRTEMVPKVVKVGAKDKVLETPIEPEVEYIKDVEKDFGTQDQRTEGEKGKAVTTTTYDVDPKDGHITEHLGNPVVTPAGKTIVKVGAKTKVERSKDPEGREVINTTTYEVDPKTGKVTPITVRTDGKSKEAKVELEQDPKTGDDTATPKTQDGSIYAPGTKVEVPDEDGKGKVPNSDLPDVEKPGTGTITEPGKPSLEVPNVTMFENGVLPDSIELPEIMIEVRWIGEDGNVLKPSLKTGNEKDAEHGSISGYEFVRTVIDENEPVMTHIFRKASGSTNPNTIPATLPKVTIFENGVLPDSIELPELMIEVRWIDEDGNVLKPSVKTGNEKDSEHGSISGYEFVRTVIDENEPVMTHIFRKASGSTNPNTIPVNPVTPDTNGNTGPDTSALTTPIPVAPVTADANGNPGQDTAAPTTSTPIPDSVTPNAKHENTTDTIDNGAKSNEFQNVLPNTGTELNATLASLGLLGLLSGFGLVVRKKKED